MEGRKNTLTVLFVVALTVTAVAGYGAVAVAQDGGADAQTPTEIDSCTVIDQPGRYVLIADISDSTEDPCIEIDGAGNVVLDGNGHTIDGTGSGIGISVSGTDNATITNVVVRDWFTGIYYEGSSGSVHDSVVRDNERTGIDIDAFASVHVSGTRITDNDVGLSFGLDSGGSATNNIVASNGIGIAVTAPVDELRSNVVRDNSRDGIVLGGVRDVIASVAIAQGVAVENNTITGNGDDGIELDTALDNVITRNTITGNGDSGIELNGTSNSNLIYDNVLENEDNVAFGSTFGDPVAGSEYPSNNTWNVSKRPGENIVGGPFIGGNYYAKPGSTEGYSEQCTDADGDGFCDQPYDLGAPNNTDFLPLTTATPDATPAASVTFENQTSDGTTVIIESVTLSEGGFVAIHNASLLEGNAFGSVVGVSEPLPAGTHENVEVTLFDVPGQNFAAEMTLQESQTLIAMPHFDSNDNGVYDFITSNGTEDAPYVANGSAVVDPAFVTVEDGEEDAEDGDDAEDDDGTAPVCEAGSNNEVLGENDTDDDGDGAIDEDDEDDDGPSNDDDDGDGAIDEDDECDDGDDGSDEFDGEAEDDDDGDGAFDEDDEADGGNSDDIDNDGDGAVDEDDEPDTDD